MEVKILNGRTHFYQWDSDQKFIVDDANVNELHFTNNAQEDASVVSCYEQEGIKLCDIPNSYLEKNGILTVYAFTYENGNYTKNTFRFNVIERPKPNDYVVEEEDINRWGELDNKINVKKDELENEINSNKEELDSKINSTKDELNNLEKDVADLQDDKAEKNHTHQYYMITGLQEKLNEKSNNGHTHGIDDVGNLSTILNDLRKNDRELYDGKANKTHTHNISDVLGLQSRLDNIVSKGHNHDERYYQQHEVHNLLNGKANSNHAHDINDIFLLQYNLDKKADTSHNHDSSYYKKTEVDDLMKNATVSDEKIASSVEKYLEENPIEGGASSWNDLEDKPFYEEISKISEITWDGNTENKIILSEQYYKVSNATPIVDELIGSVIVMNYGKEETITEDLIMDLRAMGYPLVALGEQQDIQLIFEDFEIEGEHCEKGIYFVKYHDEAYVSSWRFSKEITVVTDVKTIETKYLPKHLQFGDERNYLIPEGTMSFDENGIQCAISFLKSLDVVDVNKPIYVTINGLQYETTILEFSGTYLFGNIDLYWEQGDNGLPFFGALGSEDDGEGNIVKFIMVMMFNETSSVPISAWQGGIKPIDSKYLPEYLPHGEIIRNISFDGNLEGKEYVDYGNNMYFVKVSELTPTIEQAVCSLGKFYGVDGSLMMTAPTTQEMIVDNGSYYMTTMEYYGTPIPTVIVCLEENETFKKGTYFLYMLGMGYVGDVEFGVRINDDEIKELNEYYLPDYYNIQDDGSSLYATNDSITPYVQKKIEYYLSKGVPVYSGDTKILSYKKDGNKCMYMLADELNGGMRVGYIFKNPNTGATSYYYFAFDPNGATPISYNNSSGNSFSVGHHYLNGRYYPCFRKGDEYIYIGYVKSPSEKMFKINVDDNGNLSTEAI